MSRTIDRALFARGIRFECQCSGKCCRFRDGYDHVYVDIEERRRLARLRGMRTATFTRRFCERSGARWQLKSAKAACVFLDRGMCSVYEARPRQCRTWPFWTENMNRVTWKTEVEAFCPGIGKGKLHPASAIEKLLAEDSDS